MTSADRSFAVSLSVLPLMSASARRQPFPARFCASARPMPEPAPVTTATLSFSEYMPASLPVQRFESLLLFDLPAARHQGARRDDADLVQRVDRQRQHGL